MPDLLTHTLFSKLVRNELKNEKLTSMIEKNLNLYQLGAQGPDFFFYYKPLSPFSRRISDIGRIMHNRSTASFFIDAFNELSNKENERQDTFLVYMLGFLCHFYLDKNMHPYVNYIEKNGVWGFDGSLRKMTHYNLEYTIDIRLWKEYEKVEAVKTDTALIIEVDALPFCVVDYLKEFISYSYGIKINEKKIQGAVRNMIGVHRILYDPDYQRKFLRRMPLPRKFYIENAFSDSDVLNDKRNNWHYVGESILRRDSVYELIDKAKEEALHTIYEVADFLDGKNRVVLGQLINDVSYNTNRKNIESV